MQNIGRWNSDLVILYSAIFFFPFILYFMLGVFQKCLEFSIVKYDDSSYHPPKILNKSASKAQQGTRRKIKKQQTTINKIENTIPTTSQSIIDDAIIGLTSFGYKKTLLKQRIATLCKDKEYSSPEDLIRDFMCI